MMSFNVMKPSFHRVSVVEGMQLVAAMAGPFLSKLMKYHFGTIAVFIGIFSSTLKNICHTLMLIFSEWSLLCCSACLLFLLERTQPTIWKAETDIDWIIVSSSSDQLHKDSLPQEGE